MTCLNGYHACKVVVMDSDLVDCSTFSQLIVEAVVLYTVA